MRTNGRHSFIAPPQHRRLVVAAGVVFGLAAAAALGVVLTRGDTPTTAVVPPAVVAVDPESNTIVASIVVGSNPISIAAGEGGVWVGDQRDGTVTEIDPAARRVVRVIGIGAPAVDLAAGAGGVWVATGSFGTVVRIDPGLGAIADRIALGDPGDPIVPAVASVARSEGSSVGGRYGRACAVDPHSGEVTGRVDLGGSAALQLVGGNGAVWATVIASRAKRVDHPPAEVTAEFYAGDFVFPVAVGPQGAWVGGDRGQLWKVDPLTAAAILRSPSRGVPRRDRRWGRSRLGNAARGGVTPPDRPRDR